MRGQPQQFDPRQNMRTGDFEIFYYRDAAPGPVAIHHHDFYEVYFFLSGQVEYRVEGSVYRLEPGDVLLISPMELHQPLIQPNRESYERVVLWINRTYLEQLSTGDASLTRCFDCTRPGHNNLLRLTEMDRTGISARLQELTREAHSTDYGAALWAASSIVQLMVELNRMALRPAKIENTENERTLVSQVLDYIGEHYDESISLDSLAQQFYVSKFHLSHAFRQSVGASLYHYIQLKRLLIARQMLRNGVSPGAVCQSCGFGDYANFYRAFRSKYGASPREYLADACRQQSPP